MPDSNEAQGCRGNPRGSGSPLRKLISCLEGGRQETGNKEVLGIAKFEKKIKLDNGMEDALGPGAFPDRLGSGFGIRISEHLNFLNRLFILGKCLLSVILDFHDLKQGLSRNQRSFRSLRSKTVCTQTHVFLRPAHRRFAHSAAALPL